ncbi:MAG: hypothetical protein Q8P99_00350 [bacterium]|nr:hypothetical protein [bacterium]
MRKVEGNSGSLYERRRDEIKKVRERAMDLYKELAELEERLSWWQQAEEQKPIEKSDHKQIAEWGKQLGDIKTRIDRLDDIILESFEAEDSLRETDDALTELNQLEELIQWLKNQLGSHE